MPQADKGALSTSQARAVLGAAKERRNAARWSVGLACGLRQAEALGLRWPFLDIDVPDGEPGEMRVWYQLQRLPWRHGCDDPAGTRPGAVSAGTSGPARSGARRPRGRPAASTSAPGLAPRAFASLTAPGTRPSARGGRAEGWCSARSRNAAARPYRCRPRS